MTDTTAHIRLFASLQTRRRINGLPTTFDHLVPGTGIGAMSLAEEIGVDPTLVEGLFVNNRTAGPDAIVRPGDRVAFVPAGTPASHPEFFGRFVTR